eukprot:GHUV01033942.1.p3 GENE.GHUV01033942.1~~GHUV01033942.1.p3  ORF type:complete len:113 (-),score=28.78 GHUV01033942.1:306-644(-)
MGMFNQAARTGSIAAPCMLMLGALMGPGGAAGALVIPYLAFGAVSLLSGLLVMFMPETLGADMPESMEVRLDASTAVTAYSCGDWHVPANLLANNSSCAENSSTKAWVLRRL